MSLFSKIWSVISRPHKTSLIVLFFLLLLASFLEVLSLGAILPVISSLSNNGSNLQLLNNFESLKNLGEENLLFLFLFLFLMIFLTRTIYMVFFQWKQQTFIFSIFQNISIRLFSHYLKSSYEDFLRMNSANLLRNLSSEVTLFSETIRAYLLIFVESFILLAILILIILIDPVSLIIMICFQSLIILIYMIILRPHVIRWGNLRHLHDGKKMQWAKEAFLSFKYIKFSGIVSSFIEGFSHDLSQIAINARNQKVLQELPRLLLEFTTLVGLISAVLIQYFYFQQDIAAILVSISFLGITVFRILPSISRIISSIQSIRYADAVINLICKELSNEKNEYHLNTIPLVNESFDSLELQNVSFSYSNSSKKSLNNVSLKISKGQRVAIIGSSGSGKTTLLDIILGLLQPSSGKVLLNNKDRIKDQFLFPKFNYAPQKIPIIDSSIINNVALGVQISDIKLEQVRRSLSLASLEDLNEANESDLSLGEDGSNLSGGQAQRIGIARLFYFDSEVIILDESTSSLDGKTEDIILTNLVKFFSEKTIIIISHRSRALDYCNYVYKIDKGEIVEQGEADKFKDYFK